MNEAPWAAATPFERGLDRLVGRLIKGCEFAAMAIGIWLMCVLVVSVFFRYVLNNSLTWVDESSSLLLVWLMLAVAPIGFHENFHIAVGALIDNVPRIARVLLGLFVNACTAALFGIALYYGILNTIVELDAELFSIPLMRGWVTWVLPFASVIVLLVVLNNVIKIVRTGDVPRTGELE
ncbi:MAG: TRAP transporter small permease [Proteobacteria bacterium]|nr:TRAP transporter small permease [Pseudomonadota bacterium]